ncbi:MAG TPA: CAP domain-containing protein [bacterium]|nr:CAP domain-containing protein [bacterium]
MFDYSKQKDENQNISKYWRKNPKSIEKYQFVHHFLPKPDKRKRADFLENKAILIYCVFILVITAVFRIIPKVAPGVLGYASDINITDLLKYTNKKRGENGVSNLRLNDKLSAAAQKKAKDMFEDGYWAHVAPDGTEPWDFIVGEDYEYIYAGENLAKNFSTSKEVVEAWFKSPSHKSNLIGANYEEVGFAVVNGVMNGYETTLVVQMFGKPRQPSMLASVDDGAVNIGKNTVSASEAEPANTEGDSNVRSETSVSEEPSGTESVESEPIPSGSSANKFIDVTLATKTISLVVGGFVVSLLLIDILYSRKKGIRKFTGLTLAHMAILLVVIISIWLVFRPGLVV